MADDTLMFWHPTLDARTPDDYFDWGTIAPGSSADRTFRVRNVSYVYTATGVVVSLEELGIYDPALSVPAQHFLSMDGRSFTATVTLDMLAPREVSELITLRRVTARNADEGPGEFQVAATVTDWN